MKITAISLYVNNKIHYNTTSPAFESKLPRDLEKAGIDSAAAISATAIAGIAINKKSKSFPQKRIMQMAKEGKNPRQIALELNLNYNKVRLFLISKGYVSHMQVQREKNKDEEFIAKVNELAQKGYTIIQIAKEMNCSSASILKTLRRTGIRIKRQHMDAFEYERNEKLILEKYAQGMSAFQISKEINLPEKQVLKILNKAGIRTEYQQKTAYRYDTEIQNKIIEMGKNGDSARKISKELNIGCIGVMRILREAGIKTKNQRSNELANNKDFQKRILEMYNQGISKIKIAQLTGISGVLVKNILVKMGVESHNYQIDVETRDAILALAKEGFSIKQIAEKLNLNNKKSLIMHTLSQASIKTKRQQLIENINTEEFKNDVITRFKNNQSVHEISAALGVTTAKIIKILNDANIKTLSQLKRELHNDKSMQDLIIELAKNGYTTMQINEETGISRTAISKILADAQVVTKQQATYEKMKDIEIYRQIFEMHKNGVPNKKIAEQLGLSLMSVLGILSRNKNAE